MAAEKLSFFFLKQKWCSTNLVFFCFFNFDLSDFCYHAAYTIRNLKCKCTRCHTSNNHWILKSTKRYAFFFGSATLCSPLKIIYFFLYFSFVKKKTTWNTLHILVCCRWVSLFLFILLLKVADCLSFHSNRDDCISL